uniref:Intraflagellar transport protein 25 homolog n=1 Tax=Sus scrofa TaxID=9823 RepID=A0A8D0QR29_PIG
MKKVDLCLSSEGTEVILATSSDEKHPPENIIDGNPETFWTTTGMFPQEFIICFHKHVRIERLVIQSYFVQTLRIEKSTSKDPVDFEQWIERDLVHTEGQLQNEEIMVSTYPFFFFFRLRLTLQKLPGPGINPSHNCNPSHSSDNAGSLTCCTTRGPE